MLVCESPISAHYLKPILQMVPFTALGLAGIVGWGAVLCCFSDKSQKPTLELSFVQGMLAVVLLRVVSSSFGWVDSSVAIGVAGLLLTAYFRPRFHFNLPNGPLCLLLVGLTLLSLLLVASPIDTGDAALIWGYHGKVFTCEPIWNSDLLRERYWTWSHPEYPLLIPFLHSYFFALHDSFRDDWVLIWQAAFMFAVSLILFRTLVRAKTEPWSSAVLVLSLLFFFHRRAFGGDAELVSGLFAALVAASLVSNSFPLFSTAIIGLSLSKNEATIFALLGLGLSWVFFHELRRRQTKYLAAAVFAILIFGALLPSHHEQYARRLLSPAAWSAGLAGISEILSGMLHVLGDFPWYYFVLQIVVVAAFLPRVREFWFAMAWFAAFQVVVFAIYLVSPWGPGLYKISYFRLLLQSFPPLFLISGWVLLNRGKVCLRASVALLVIASLNPMILHLAKQPTLVIPQTDRVAARISGDIWVWDQTFPVPTRTHTPKIAVLRHQEVRQVMVRNYFLYPRKIYAQAPDLVFGTWRPSTFWTELPERYRLQFDSSLGWE